MFSSRNPIPPRSRILRSELLLPEGSKIYFFLKILQAFLNGIIGYHRPGLWFSAEQFFGFRPHLLKEFGISVGIQGCFVLPDAECEHPAGVFTVVPDFHVHASGEMANAVNVSVHQRFKGSEMLGAKFHTNNAANHSRWIFSSKSWMVNNFPEKMVWNRFPPLIPISKNPR